MRERVDRLLVEVEGRKKTLTDSQALEMSIDVAPSHSVYVIIVASTL